MEGRLARRHGIVWIATISLLLVGMGPLTASAGTTVHTVAPGESIQDALDAAQPGDTVQLLAGVHQPSNGLLIDTPDITLEGIDRDGTVLDGDNLHPQAPQKHAIEIVANDVTVRSLTIQHFTGHGVFYHDVTGFLVEEVTAIANGPYGIYAIRSELGTFRDSYAAGHADSGFYLGEVGACECVIENVIAEDNLIGYSGTGASHIIIRDSLFQNNAAGVVPNVLPNEPEAQTNLMITDNVVRDNNNQTASDKWHFSQGVHVPSGLGIVIAGGIDDLVRHNVVTGHERAGVAISFLFTEPSLNRVLDNTLDNPGDDILWDGGGVNNCFEGNTRLDGSPATFDAGTLWNTVGELPDCSTPNAGAPDPGMMTRLVSLLIFNCEPWEQPGAPCHSSHLAGGGYGSLLP